MMAGIQASSYVEQAEKVIQALKKDNPRGKIDLTTSKIRNILSMVSELYNDAQRFREETLSEEMASRVQYLKMRIAYEAGRDMVVRKFIEKADLLKEIDQIHSSKERLILFCHYVEALVAYHRFYGGRAD